MHPTKIQNWVQSDNLQTRRKSNQDKDNFVNLVNQTISIEIFQPKKRQTYLAKSVLYPRLNSIFLRASVPIRILNFLARASTWSSLS